MPRKAPADVTAHWNAQAAALLLGHKIVGVSYMDAKEAENCGWERRPLAIELDNGVVIFPSSDDEGNDAGALFTTSETTPVLPVL